MVQNVSHIGQLFGEKFQKKQKIPEKNQKKTFFFVKNCGSKSK